MVTIIYLALGTFPDIKANTIQTVRMCDALAKIGCDVYLLIPARFKNYRVINKYRDISRYYGITGPFRVIPIPTIWFWTRNKKANIILHLIAATIFVAISYVIIVLIKLFQKRLIVMTRIPLILCLLYFLKPLSKFKIIYESHDFYYEYNTQGKLKKLFIDGLKYAKLIITTNLKLEKEIKKLLSTSNKIITLRNAFDELPFLLISEEKELLRKKLGLPLDKWIVAYVGQLWSWKRPEFIIDAYQYVQDKDTSLLFVGGTKDDIKRLKRYAEQRGVGQIIFRQFVPPVEVPKYLLAADCLVHYTPSTGMIKSYSPLKLFEYMAAGKPILAPRQPWIEEILRDGENALLFDENSPIDLAEKIKQVKNNPEIAERLARNAKQESTKYTYQKRAEQLINHIKKII